jgi:hypothetical protein
MAVEYARGGRFERRSAVEGRLERAGLGSGEHAQIGDAVARALGLQLLQPGNLLRAGGDDQLAAATMRHAVLGEKRIEGAPACDAHRCL